MIEKLFSAVFVLLLLTAPGGCQPGGGAGRDARGPWGGQDARGPWGAGRDARGPWGAGKDARGPVDPPATGSARSMKGFELYSWQAGEAACEGGWCFALVAGTNRIKTYEEITSSEVRVGGLDALKRELGQLASGEQVFWLEGRVPNTALPPDDVIEEVRGYCEQRGIRLHVLTSDVRWDPSPSALIVRYYSPHTTAGLAGAYDRRYYVPEVQMLGDGRIIWVRREGTGRRVLEGRLTPDQMKAFVQRIVDAGFFGWEDEYYTLGGNSYPPMVLSVSLIGRSREVSEHGGAPDAYYELVEYLTGGTGAAGYDYVPTQGYLTAAPGPEAADAPTWPDATAGITLDQVGGGRYVEGQALAFAWRLVNQNPTSPVYARSKGQVYSIMVQIPGVSFFEPPPPAQAGPTVQVTETVHTGPTPAASPGANWVHYPSLNDVRGLAFAPDGALWAATGGGVVRWDLAADTCVRYGTADGLASEDITDLALAPDSSTLRKGKRSGALWVATRGGGVSRFDGEDWLTYTEAHGLVDNIVYGIATAPDGSVWVGTQGGAGHFDGTAWSSYTAADGLGGDVVWYLALTPDGDVWFSTHAGGVSRYSPGSKTWRTYGSKDGLPLPNARFLTVAPDGALWLHIGYDHVYRFDGTTWRLAYEVGGGRWVCDMAFATDGSPWIATCGALHAHSAGLAHLDGATWTYVTAADGLVDNDLTAVAVGPDGAIAAGTVHGLSVYQAGRWRTLRTGPNLSRATSVAVTPDGAPSEWRLLRKSGAAWFGFGDSSVSNPGGGLSRFADQAWQYFLDGAEVSALAVALDGALWVGAGCAVHRFDGTVWVTMTECGQDLSPGNVLDIGFTPDGAAWVATGFTLARFDGQSWTRYDKLVNSLAVAPDGAIWVNGWEGRQGSQYVARFDGERWTTYKSTDSYPGGFMVGAVTADGLVWGVDSERRLACFDGGSWTDGQSWTFYGTADGLPSDRIVDLVIAPKGVLWAITDAGIAYVDGGGWKSIPLGDLPGTINDMAVAPDGSVWLATSRGAVHLEP